MSSDSCFDARIMGLTNQEKSDARDALAMALELNEPEIMIEGLKRLCARKLEERHISDNERNRWRDAHNALEHVQSELELANAPAKRDNDAQSDAQTEQAGQKADY